MQILMDTHDLANFLENFSISIKADTASWQGWVVLPITSESELDLPARNHLGAILRAIFSSRDGIILHLDAHNVLVICHPDEAVTLTHVLKELNRMGSGRLPLLAVSLLHLAEQPNDIEKIIRPYMKAGRGQEQTEGVDHTFVRVLVPHISELLKAWMTTSKTRQTRDKPHILIVDDDATTRHIISRALKNDYPISTASSAQEGIEKHLTLSPDIIFLDIDLPDCDGFTVLHSIRTYDPSCHVIMFSSNSYMTNRMKAFAAGAVGFIAKPFNKRSFERYITMWQEQHGKKTSRA